KTCLNRSRSAAPSTGSGEGLDRPVRQGRGVILCRRPLLPHYFVEGSDPHAKKSSGILALALVFEPRQFGEAFDFGLRTLTIGTRELGICRTTCSLKRVKVGRHGPPPFRLRGR